MLLSHKLWSLVWIIYLITKNNLPRETTINDLRNLKGWSPLSHFYTKRILSITYKSFHGLNNDLLNKLVTKSAQVYGLRKSLNINVTRPKTEKGRLTFKHRAAIAWNTLPDSIKEAPSLEAFKEKLKKNKLILSSISYSKESSSITNKDDIYTYFWTNYCNTSNFYIYVHISIS